MDIMLILLTFLRMFITMIGTVAKVESVVKFAQSLPQTLYMAKSYIGLGQDEFEKFVACPKCCTLYKTEECTVRKTNGRVAKCQSEINSIVRNTGAKYSVLFQLPYYDAVRFVIIDPMHNLFLGLAKSTLKVWKENDLIGEKDFGLLQRRVNPVVPPPEIGRIPSKIATGFSGFTGCTASAYVGLCVNQP